MRVEPPLILNVDDEEASRYAKSRVLTHSGMRVVEVATGYEALQKAEQLQPAIVLLDVRLPDISGHEVCRRVKERWPQIMVLQTSATYTTGADRTRGLDIGADSYLTQPIEPQELVAAIRALLRLRDAEVTLRSLNQTLEQRVPDAFPAPSGCGEGEHRGDGAQLRRQHGRRHHRAGLGDCRGQAELRGVSLQALNALEPLPGARAVPR